MQGSLLPTDDKLLYHHPLAGLFVCLRFKGHGEESTAGKKKSAPSAAPFSYLTRAQVDSSTRTALSFVMSEQQQQQQQQQQQSRDSMANYNNNNNNNNIDTSESTMGGGDGTDRFEEASESGGLMMMTTTTTEMMEHVSTANSADDSVTNDYSGSGAGNSGKSKGKSRRLSKRVAHTIKKQWKSSDKDKSSNKGRSLSPSRNNSGGEDNSESESEEAEMMAAAAANNNNNNNNNADSDKDKERKKKHKSKFKPVAKAAASAAKKIAGKKSSTTKRAEETYEQLQYALSTNTGSADSSRATSPTDHLIHASNSNTPATSTGMPAMGGVAGKTPMNTPVTATSVVDGTNIEQLAHDLPPTLTEEDEEEEEESGGDTFNAEKSMEFSALKQPSSTSTLEQTEATTVSSEDDMLRMAEAMAMAVEKNPTKTHEEIRRIVLAQPEFQHLALPDNGSSSSSSKSKKGFKKTFGSFQSKLTSGAGTAQKKLMEYANAGVESTLGSSVTSFGGFMGSTTSGTSSTGSERDSVAPREIPAAAAVGATLEAASTLGKAGGDAVHDTASAGSGFKTQTNPEDSVASLDVPTDASSASLATGVTVAQQSGTDAANIPTPASAVKGDLPIKLTGILWKRRSGFGVLRSSPWERRHFVLQGNSLSYYRAKGESGGEGTAAAPMDDATERYYDNRGVDVNDAGVSHKSSSSTKQRMYDVLGQASTSLGLSTAPVAPSSEKLAEGSSARGSMDLVKENATICATWGHSGAPSPFCLSIKVKGETKWKLCFASHRSQLQWLAAMTDTVVQASVDSYNIKLLTNADPANQDPVTAAFQSHVSEPPVSEKSLGLPVVQPADADNLLPQPSMHVSGRRLWIMEPYVIKAQNGFSGSGEADDDESASSYESDDDVDDDEAALAVGVSTKDGLADDDDKIVWSVPESKLVFASIVVNAAILYCRNSTISVEVFWTVVTIANMTLFSFLEAGTRPRTQSTDAATAGARSSVKRPRKTRRRKAKRDGSAGAGAKKSGGDAAGKVKKEKFLPVAGTSALKIKDLSDPCKNAKGDAFTRWRAIEGDQLQVRSHGYKTTNKKIGSPGSLYELSQMDLFESPARYPDMAPRVKLPKLSYSIDADENKTWVAPDNFIVSLALPTDPPKLGSNTSDGGGYTVTMYFTMRKTTRDILKRVTADGYDPNSEDKPDDIQTYQVNAVRLFEEWCRRAPNDKAFLTRFKMVPLVVNAKEIGLPSWIGKYNGKPLLIKRPGQTGFLLPHPEISCIEFDISLHVFPYLAKQGICYLKDTLFKNLIASVGFVIEGRDDDELPEVVIGLGQVVCPDPAIGIQGADFFAGTAPRSFDPEEVKPPEATAPAAASAPAAPAKTSAVAEAAP